MLTIDAHCDILYTTVKREDWGLARLSTRAPQWSIPLARAGGISLQVCSIYTTQWRRTPGESLRMGIRMAGIFRRIPEKFPHVVHVTRSRQIREAHRQGRLGLMLSIEGPEAIGGDLDILRSYAGLGIRIFGLAWNPANPLATGCAGNPKARLTPLGRKSLKLCAELGVVIDVSHLNEGGFWDVVERNPLPFVATHSNARALCDHRRNLRDAQLKALARRGGVAGVVFYSGFVKKTGPASLADVVAHLDRIVQTAGIDHAGIGADYEGMRRPVPALKDAGRMPRLWNALSKRYSDRDIAKIAGGNFLRVFEQIF